MPKVFIPNKGAHDFSDAERYGELVFVTKGELSKFACGTMARCWASALNTATKDDFIAVSSLTTLCTIGAALFARKFGTLNLLIFRNGKYMARHMLLSQLLEELELKQPNQETIQKTNNN